MNKKIFRYENKNNKLLRVKDLLMLFSIFAICIISIVYAGTKANEDAKNNNVTVVSNDDASVETENAPQQVSAEKESDASSGAEENVTLPELKFEVPVDGAVIKPFSQYELIYSETMDDWRIHNGVDLTCPYGTDVLSAERGRVKTITHDINLGNVVTVETDGFELIYASLSADIPVKEGQILKKGDLIGKTSDSCMMEICDDPHIHFEMKKNGEYVDPLEYILFK